MVTSSVLPMIHNENDYTTIRRQLLYKPTILEYQIASRLAKTMTSNSKEEMTDLLIKGQLEKESKSINNLIIHYIHEERLSTYKKDIHQLWNKIFRHIPVIHTRLIVGNRNSENLTQELVRRHPQT